MAMFYVSRDICVMDPDLLYFYVSRDICVVDPDWLYDAAPSYFKRRNISR